MNRDDVVDIVNELSAKLDQFKAQIAASEAAKRSAEIEAGAALAAKLVFEKSAAILSHNRLQASADEFDSFLRMSRDEFDYDLKLIANDKRLLFPKARYTAGDCWLRFIIT